MKIDRAPSEGTGTDTPWPRSGTGAWTGLDVAWVSLIAGCPLAEIASYFAFRPGWGRLCCILVGQTVAALVCFLLARRLARPGVGATAPTPFWKGMAFGMLAWFLGNLAFTALEVGFRVGRRPGLQDLFFLPAYLGMFLALSRVPRQGRRDSTFANNLIEAAGILIATLLVGWQFRLHEAALAFVRAPGLATGYPLVYPLLDVALLWVLSVRARNQERSGIGIGTFGWLIGGLFALILADFSTPDIMARIPLQAGGGFSDLGRGIFSSLWAAAALQQLRRRRGVPVADGMHPFVSREMMLLVINSSWVLGMLALLILGLFSSGARQLPEMMALGLVAVLALVIVRQIRESMGNERLNLLAADVEESRGQFRQLFRLFPDAALLSQLDDGVLVEVNDGFTRLYGFERSECVGRSGIELGLWADPADRPAFIADLRLHLRINQREASARNKGGAVVPVEMSARLVELGGRHYLLNLVRDLSDKKAAEERLRRNEIDLRRAQKLEAIGGLAGGIAHDLNNMLTPIMGGTELALLNLPEAHKARPDLVTVLEASKRARALVRQILTFSRRTETRTQVVETGPIISEVLGQIRPQLGPGARLQHIRRDPPAVLGDDTQLHQVILNLCTNAAHALAGRPEGRIEVIEESYDATDAAGPGPEDFRPGIYLHLSVRDTGCGMSAAVLERIFEPFYTTRKANEGTGLGLAVVHGIVRQHAGVLKVYSSPGEGSIFHVYLPAAPGAAAAPAAAEGPGILAGSGQKIACVDDDVLVLGTLSGLVRRLGYEPVSFASATAAETFLNGPDSGAVGAVICDFAMPELDGITLAQRAGRRLTNLPWILLSGYLNEETLRRARAAGLEHFMDKPPSMDQLARALHRLFRKPAGKISPSGGDA